jgi:hypothetical protein
VLIWFGSGSGLGVSGLFFFSIYPIGVFCFLFCSFRGGVVCVALCRGVCMGVSGKGWEEKCFVLALNCVSCGDVHGEKCAMCNGIYEWMFSLLKY